jgi:small basic protein
MPSPPRDLTRTKFPQDWQRDVLVVVLFGVVVLVEDFVLVGDQLGLDVFELVGFFADVGYGACRDGAAL